MGALANAAQMARDSQFRDRALAALVYRAREVIADGQKDSDRYRFARIVVQQPLQYQETAAWVLASDPEVAANPLATMLLATGETLMLARIGVAWDYLTAVFGPYPRG